MNDNRDFTTGSIPKKLLRFMLPVLGALALQSMYSAVDLLIVGKFGSTAGISGVTTGSGILHMVTFTLAAMTTAVTAQMGRYLGEGRREKLGGLVGSSICFFFLASAVLSVVLVVCARPLAIVMRSPEEALEQTVLYIRICGAGFVFVVFYNFISSIFRGLGDSAMPLIIVAIACGVNIVGDLVLVAGFGMDVAGAAIATVAAQAISVLMSLVIMKRRGLPFTMTRKDLRFSEEIPRFVATGAPLALQEFLTSVTFLALCAFINRLGLDASSGYGVGQKIQSFIMLIPSSLMQSMTPVVAQNVGAGRYDRAKSAMKWGMAFGASIGVVIAVGIFFKGDLVSALFSDDKAVIARSFEFLRGFAIEAVVTSILFSFMGYFNGHSRTLFVMLQGLAQSFLVRLPVSYVASIRPNASLTHVGLAAPAATVFGIALCLWYYKRMSRQMKSDLFQRHAAGEKVNLPE